MKTNRWVLLCAFTLAGLSATAQDYAFKVLMNKGSNEVKSGSAWQQVKTGVSLKPGDEVKLVDNAYLGLMHVSGRPLELTKAGTFKVADLASKVSGGSSVLNKYTEFMLSSNSPEAKKNRLSATGAVDRGDKEAIQIYLPTHQFSGVLNNKVIISWDGSAIQGPYILELKDMFEDLLARYETNEPWYAIDMKDPKFSNSESNAVMLKVISKNDPKQISADRMIKKLSAEEAKNTMLLWQMFPTAIGNETALDKYYLAYVYEQNGLLVDAATAYQEAIQLAPDIYKEAYEEFLLRNGMKKVK